MVGFKKGVNTLKDILDGMGERRLGVYSASGAYYFFMSLVPIVMIVCCLLPYTPLTQEILLEYVNDYIPESMAEVVERIVADVYDSSAATLTISILLTLYSASAAVKALMRGMDAAYGKHRRENYLHFQLRALVYMVILVAAILLSLCVMVYGGKILNLVENSLPYPSVLQKVLTLLRGLRFLVSMGVLTLFFSALYKWMPAGKIRHREQWAGAAFAAVVWVLFSSAFSLYVSLSGKYGPYGLIGTVMIAMMWMYFCLYFLLIGGFLNSFRDHRRKEAEKRAQGIIDAPSMDIGAPEIGKKPANRTDYK